MGDGLRAVIWVRAEGIEPSASDLKGPRSTTELRPQDWYIITGRLLYHLSYAVMHKGMSYLSTKLVYHDSSRPTHILDCRGFESHRLIFMEAGFHHHSTVCSQKITIA